jgi:hypothetical protein
VPLEVISKVTLLHQDLKTTQKYLGKISEVKHCAGWMYFTEDRGKMHRGLVNSVTPLHMAFLNNHQTAKTSTCRCIINEVYSRVGDGAFEGVSY